MHGTDFIEVFVFFNLVRKLKQKSRQKKPFENKTTALGSVGLLVHLCRRTHVCDNSVLNHTVAVGVHDAEIVLR
jgi:hypothetical protein